MPIHCTVRPQHFGPQTKPSSNDIALQLDVKFVVSLVLLGLSPCHRQAGRPAGNRVLKRMDLKAAAAGPLLPSNSIKLPAALQTRCPASLS